MSIINTTKVAMSLDSLKQLFTPYELHPMDHYVKHAAHMNTLSYEEKVKAGYNVNWKCWLHNDSQCTEYSCV